jgi:hypothetical protein
VEHGNQRYRRLPGRRRGFIFGSSIWMGSDHLLLVKSARFREDYKRFYFRDIQAIVTAKAPRFHISTRSALIALLWLCALAAVNGLEFGLNARGIGMNLTWAWWTVSVALIATWIWVSVACSCRCRIYTAVSSDELPSLYRTWTARRFLEKVEPKLVEAQGVVEANWADAVEERQVGPLPEGRTGLASPGTPTPPPPPPPSKTVRTPISVLFVASLCLGGLAELLTVRAAASVGRWILLGFVLLQIATAVAVVVQNYMGKLRPSMRNLAIVALASVGFWYYAVQMAAGVAISLRNARSRNPAAALQTQVQPLGLLDYPVSRGIAGGIGLLLGFAGAGLLLLGERPSEEKVSFNV